MLSSLSFIKRKECFCSKVTKKGHDKTKLYFTFSTRERENPHATDKRNACLYFIKQQETREEINTCYHDNSSEEKTMREISE